jgi:hypothetical protein
VLNENGSNVIESEQAWGLHHFRSQMRKNMANAVHLVSAVDFKVHAIHSSSIKIFSSPFTNFSQFVWVIETSAL